MEVERRYFCRMPVDQAHNFSRLSGVDEDVGNVQITMPKMCRRDALVCREKILDQVEVAVQSLKLLYFRWLIGPRIA